MTARVERRTYRRSCGRCGWSGTYETAGRANYGKRRHSCTRWLNKAASRERGLAKSAAVDRTPKPCHHKRAKHQHGEYATYVHDSCRCGPCAAAHATYEDNRVRQQAYGRWNGLVDAEPVRDHVLELMSAGMGLKRVGTVAGVPHGSLSKLIYGVYKDGVVVRKPSTRIKPENAERLLAVQLDLAGGAKIDGTGTRRRLQALTAIGYSHSYLGRAIGLSSIYRTIHGLGDGLVLRRTAERTKALYDRLSMTPNQPSRTHDRIAAVRSRNYAAANGWLAPLAWDDDLIDDPDHAPDLTPAVSILGDTELDEVAIYRRMHGDKTVRLSRTDAIELVRRCREAGWTWVDIERRAGLKAERYLPAAQEAS